MNKLWKIFYWLAGLLVVILVGVYFAGPQLINSELVKGKIENVLSQKVGGDVGFQHIDFSIFPLPVVIVRSGSISTDIMNGIMKSFSVYPKILPILTGRLQASRLLVSSPDFDFKLKECGNGQDCGRPVSAESIANVLGTVAQELPDLVVIVEDGNFNLLKEDRTLFEGEDVDVRVNFPPEGLRVIKADVKSSVLKLTARQKDKDIVIQASGLQAGFYCDEDKTSISISELIFDYPELALSGELGLDNNADLITLSLHGSDVDVESTRKAVLGVAGDIPLIQKIFRIVKGGAIPSITFNSQARSFTDLKKLTNMVIKGIMKEGKIFVPGAKMDLENVHGDVVIANGFLHGENLEARLENAKGSEGKLRLGLRGKDAPFHLEINLDVDLSELPPLLKRLVRDENVVKEITRIRNIKGKSRGRLTLGESLKSVRAIVDVEALNLIADYERIPYGLEIDGGRFLYDRAGIGVQNLTGNVGKSSFSGLAAKIELGEAPILEIEDAKAIIIVDEIYQWLLSYEKLNNGLKHVKSAEGILELSQLNLKGPLLNPDDWHFTAKGHLKSLVFDTALSHGPVTVKQGKLEADERTIHVKDAEINIRDALFQLSGKFNYPEGLTSDLTLSGQIGPEAAEWLSDFINLPSALRVRPPLSVSQARLIMEKDSTVSFTGSFSLQKATEVCLDLVKSPDELMIKNLRVRDSESDAALGFTMRSNAFDFRLDGHLTEPTLGRIFTREIVTGRWIKGLFNAHISVERPGNSSFQGTLEGKDIIFPWKLKEPLMVNSLSLEGRGNNLHIGSAVLTLEERQLSLKGDVTASDIAFLIDMDLFSDGIHWDTVSTHFKKEEGGEETGLLGDFPLEGILRVKSNSFTYDRYTWKPFYADIAFNRDTTDITVTDAVLCGISFPGTLKVTPQYLSLDFQPVARNQNLEPTISCLIDISRYMTGEYTLDGNLKADGMSEDIMKALKGNLKFNAAKGRIYQYGLLSKILSFLNLTEVIRGRLPDFVGEGFAYKSIAAEADIQGSELSIEKFIIDGSSMEIAAQGTLDLLDKQVDLKVLVAPLKTADFVIRKIPVIRDVFGGTLISIPVRVKGDFDNPEMSYLSPSDIGSGLVGIMKNALKAPVKIVKPLLPDNDKGKK